MHQRRPDPDLLREVLTAHVGPPLSLEQIESGTSGTSYRVVTAAGEYAAKQFFADADVLLGPAAQYQLLEQLAALDIGPAPVACDDGLGLLVTEWIRDARPATTADLSDPRCIREIAALLRVLHSTESAVPDFRPQAWLARYVAAIGGYAALGGQDRSRHAELLDLVVAFDSGARCLCHNDLVAENCFTGSRPRLIDFDFACAAPPMLDLASLAEMNHLDDAASRVLLSAYFGDDVGYLHELVRARRLVCLLAHFWALASADAGAAEVAQYRIEND